MAYYLRSKKLDISAGDPLVVLLNTKEAQSFGLHMGDKLYLCWHDVCLYVAVDFSDSMVGVGEIGMFNEVWVKYGIPSDDLVSISLTEPAKSHESIRKKILGYTLNYDEIHGLMDDIAKRRLSTIMMTYFAAASYNPGFNENEIVDLTRAMAETGDILDFSGGDPNKKIVDKHSIGGIPAKGVTPILVPIIALFGLTIPNTSSRAITTPAGTSDMLEVVMPVSLTKEQIMTVVKKEGACLVWGGGLDIAPADDILIGIERPLNIESHDKFLVSIVAKKAAMRVSHLLVDLPYGDGAKIANAAGVEDVKKKFINLAAKFGIRVEVYARESKGPDGYGVGPILEMRDLLRIFERDPQRPVELENAALEMTGKLLELAGAVAPGEGAKLARAKLESGEAGEKFWKIAFAQGATKIVKSSDLKLGAFSEDIPAVKSGTIEAIGNKQVVEIARALGAPFIKDAGLYFHKLRGDKVNAGEPLVTLYANCKERLDLGKEIFKRCGDFIKFQS